MKYKCLLVGGAGFIGKNLALCLNRYGHDISVYDCIVNPFSNGEELGIKYIKGDYFGTVIDKEIIAQQDIIILLACSVGPETSMKNPEQCYGQDIIKMIQLLEQMKAQNVNRMFFISSGGTVYGNVDASVYKEDMETLPINHYGIMKLTQEKILLMYNKLYGMNNVIFRLSNPYGFGQQISSGIGAVTAFLNQIDCGERICIYGKGEVVRDYIHINDAVEMIRLFMEKEKKTSPNPIFNIGTGIGTSILELVKTIEQVTGKEAEIEYKQGRSIDVKRNVLSNEKIKEVIGEYECQSLKDGIRQYYCNERKSS